MPKMDDQDTSDVVSTLLRTLEGGGNEEKAEGLMRLAMTLDECSGAEGAQLGAAMRAAGGIELLVQHVDHEDPTVHQTVLHLIANFSAKAVDARNEDTQRMLKELGAFAKLLRHIFSDDPLTLEYALGGVRNTCRDPEHVTLMQEAGALPRLEALTRSGDSQLEAYAEDVRRSMTEAILDEEASGYGLVARTDGAQRDDSGSSSPPSPARSTTSSEGSEGSDTLAPLSPSRCSPASATSPLGRSRPESASHRPESASHRPQSRPESASHRPESASHRPQSRPESASHRPQSASHRPQSASHRPESASHRPKSAARGATSLPERAGGSRRPIAGDGTQSGAMLDMHSGEWPPRVPDLRPQAESTQSVNLHSEVRALHDDVAAQGSRLAAQDAQMRELRRRHEELQQHVQQQERARQSLAASLDSAAQQQLRQEQEAAALAAPGLAAAAKRRYAEERALKRFNSDQQIRASEKEQEIVAHAMWRYRQAALEAEGHAQRARAQFSKQMRQLMLREVRVRVRARVRVGVGVG